jgi:hypothetical protein
MPTLMNYSDACSRFANLASTGISIADAVLEAVERIYEMGRFPGTTAEVVLEESDFVFDPDVNAHFVYLDDSIYDGAIGFRSDTRGWGIVDQAVLYKDGVNAGDLDFVDYGTNFNGVSHLRKYRAPMGFSPSNGPYYALMKLECPEMNDNTIIQVPTGPLKSAVLAVCQEYVGDDERALLNWQKFDQFMTRSERQTHGPKKMFISFDSSLRRRPTQFM